MALTDLIIAPPRIGVTVAEPLRSSQHPVIVYLASMAEGSRPTVRSKLNVIAEIASQGRHDAMTFPWGDLRYQHTAAIRAELASRYSAATANNMLSFLRRVLKECWRLGHMSAEDERRAADIRPVSGTVVPRGRMLERDEFVGLLQACLLDRGPVTPKSKRRSPIGMRDAALIATLFGAGLRRAEAAALRTEDYFRGALKVRGKRNKERRVPVPPGLRRALVDWLQIRGTEPGRLFLRIHKSGSIQRTGISAQVIGDIVRRRALEAGLRDAEGIADITPHDFRRTYISTLLTTVDIATVKRLAGHANIQTTQAYDRRPEAAAAEAVEAYDVPYSRPGGSA